MNVSLTISSGITYPPKNRIAVSELISTIDAYSARKKKTKMMAECSVKNPATSSDSVVLSLLRPSGSYEIADFIGEDKRESAP